MGRQIIPKSATLDQPQHAHSNAAKETRYERPSQSSPAPAPLPVALPEAPLQSSFTPMIATADVSSGSTLREMAQENARLKTNVDALQRMLLIHESALQK